MTKRQKVAEEKRQPTNIGRKILVRGESLQDLAVLLRHLALDVEGGNDYMNASDMYGLRMMRPLEKDEKDYLSAKDLP